MNQAQEILQQAAQQVAQAFEMELSQSEQLSEEALRDQLAEYVLYWVERNLEHLFAILYRLDIDEAKVHQAFAPEAPEPANLTIAQLIIDREKQRIASRLKYRQDYTQDNDDITKW